MASDLLTVAEVREHVTTGLSDAALERVIDGQDAYIRRMVGEHDPATTMVYENDNRTIDCRFWLPRPASSIDMLEDRRRYYGGWFVRDASAYYLSDGGRSVNISWGQSFRELVRVTFTPVPENIERAQALIDLVRLETQDTGLNSERDDTFSYTAKDKAKVRREVITPLKHGYRRLA